MRLETPMVINKFLNKMENTFGTKPNWLISDNAGEYTSAVVVDMLGDMDVDMCRSSRTTPKKTN